MQSDVGTATPAPVPVAEKPKKTNKKKKKNHTKGNKRDNNFNVVNTDTRITMEREVFAQI